MGHKRCDEYEFKRCNRNFQRSSRTGPSRVARDFQAGGITSGQIGSLMQIQGGRCEVSAGVARQRAVMILPSLVPLEMFDRLEFAIA